MGLTLQYQPARLPNCVEMCLLESRQMAQNGLAVGSDTCRQLMGRWHQQTWLKQISWDLICLPLRRWWECDKNFLGLVIWLCFVMVERWNLVLSWRKSFHIVVMWSKAMCVFMHDIFTLVDWVCSYLHALNLMVRNLVEYPSFSAQLSSERSNSWPNLREWVNSSHWIKEMGYV